MTLLEHWVSPGSLFNDTSNLLKLENVGAALLRRRAEDDVQSLCCLTLRAPDSATTAACPGPPD